MSKVTRPAIRYHGGKWKLAPWIISHFPEHRVYTESFGGGASVLLQKPRSYAEIYNDLDGEVVNLFRVLRSPATCAELKAALLLTPFAREEFESAYVATDNAVEAARRMIVRSYMGFSSAATNAAHRTGFRANSNRSGSTPAHDWANYPQNLDALCERLRAVVIESRPAVQVMQAHDAETTLHYVDPPYVHSTRSFKERQTGTVYSHEMTDAEHEELAGALHALQGGVILSGYPCDLYNDLYAGWQRVEREVNGDARTARTEDLWLNDRAGAVISKNATQFSFNLEATQ